MHATKASSPDLVKKKNSSQGPKWSFEDSLLKDPTQFNARMSPIIDDFTTKFATFLDGKKWSKEKILEDLLKYAQGTYQMTSILPTKSEIKRRSSNDACSDACFAVCVDALVLLLDACGVEASLIGEVADEIAGDVAVTMLTRYMDAVKAAQAGWDTASAIVQLICAIFNMCGLGEIGTALQKYMNWWDWLVVGIALAAQITFMIVSEGTSIIAEILVFSSEIAQTVTDCVSAVQACSTTFEAPQEGAIVQFVQQAHGTALEIGADGAPMIRNPPNPSNKNQQWKVHYDYSKKLYLINQGSLFALSGDASSYPYMKQTPVSANLGQLDIGAQQWMLQSSVYFKGQFNIVHTDDNKVLDGSVNEKAAGYVYTADHTPNNAFQAWTLNTLSSGKNQK